MLTIKAPKGAKIIRPYNYYGEKEAIVDRGSRYHIASVKITGWNDSGPELEIGLTLDEEKFE